MTIAAGETILASDINAIKADVDALSSASSATVTTAETTTSTTYTDLATSGPAVTLTTGTKAIVIVTVEMAPSTAASGREARVSFAISGATTQAATDGNCLHIRGGGTTDEGRASSVNFVSGLTAGSNTFTTKYRVNAGTGTFQRRTITVIPVGAT